MRKSLWPLACVTLLSVALLGAAPTEEGPQYVSQWKAEMQQIQERIASYPSRRMALIEDVNAGKVSGDPSPLFQDLDAKNKLDQVRLKELQFLFKVMESKAEWQSEIEQIEGRMADYDGRRKSLQAAVSAGKVGSDSEKLFKDMDARNAADKDRVKELKYMIKTVDSKKMPLQYVAVMGVCLLVAVVSIVDARKARKRLADIEQSGLAPEPPSSPE